LTRVGVAFIVETFVLENVNLKRKLSRPEYEQVAPALQRRLYELERVCWQEGISSIVVFEGWDAAGKGSCISALTQRLDPRGFKLHAIDSPRTFERSYPWLWRYWLKVPNRGEMVIFDRSWYRRVVDEYIDGAISLQQQQASLKDILEFERMLADDGTAVIKFFLHISKNEQKCRFKKIESDPLESWRITRQDWRRHKKYDEYFETFEEVLELTDSDASPWTIVEATSRWYARIKVFETIIAALEARMGGAAPPPSQDDEDARKDADLRSAMSTLEPEEAVP
jgi:polyphosphate kinase 2 (PPK2 family)